MPEKKVLSARFQASFLMDNILSEKRLLADLNLNLIMQNLSAADRARSQRLLLNTLRHLERADALLLPLLKKRPTLKILNILYIVQFDFLLQEFYSILHEFYEDI